MLPVECVGCHKTDEASLEGLHPFITSYAVCTVYQNTSWISRRGGCAFNVKTSIGTPKAKVNPLKASKRSTR